MDLLDKKYQEVIKYDVRDLKQYCREGVETNRNPSNYGSSQTSSPIELGIDLEVEAEFDEKKIRT